MQQANCFLKTMPTTTYIYTLYKKLSYVSSQWGTVCLYQTLFSFYTLFY